MVQFAKENWSNRK